MSDLDLGALLREAQQMREKVEFMQRTLADQIVEGASGGGMVKVKVSGAMRVMSIEIDPAVLHEDREMLQDLVVAALNQGLERARELAQERLGSLMPGGGMFPGGIPGL